jgi:hypothetical protein
MAAGVAATTSQIELANEAIQRRRVIIVFLNPGLRSNGGSAVRRLHDHDIRMCNIDASWPRGDDRSAQGFEAAPHRK